MEVLELNSSSQQLFEVLSRSTDVQKCHLGFCKTMLDRGQDTERSENEARTDFLVGNNNHQVCALCKFVNVCVEICHV
jgi:hypothetical protein